jgi:hypothetical protein
MTPLPTITPAQLRVLRLLARPRPGQLEWAWPLRATGRRCVVHDADGHDYFHGVRPLWAAKGGCRHSRPRSRHGQETSQPPRPPRRRRGTGHGLLPLRRQTLPRTRPGGGGQGRGSRPGGAPGLLPACRRWSEDSGRPPTRGVGDSNASHTSRASTTSRLVRVDAGWRRSGCNWTCQARRWGYSVPKSRSPSSVPRRNTNRFRSACSCGMP